ncbi:hypothetical protein [Psychroflexus montanilacus]|uniref:hypothetical protein n=1 Tax=Psychroflexus montanilacus TaxID=2873598 RepID=UPI001CCB828D|nr:hypothetical protein [Psychroflexus montanilacus]MBZ9652568.1 hypothetical protein [Psychroflexus montanilacus]
MNFLSFCYKIYYFIPDFSKLGFVGKAINKLLEILLKKLFDFFVPKLLLKTQNNFVQGVSSTKINDSKIIVSLTSFPERINHVWVSIECLLRQSYKPNMIILWLSKDQFKNVKLPHSLLSQTKRGLTIKFCDDDLKAHKKYFYSIQKNPNDIIITYDDDLYYDKWSIERIMKLHSKYPKFICTNRAHEIKFDFNNQILPYAKWNHRVTKEKPSFKIVQTGGAGTLYPKNSLNTNVLNKDLIIEKCLFADDLWLKIHSLINGIKVVTNSSNNKQPITTTPKSFKTKLISHNGKLGGNDVQLMSLIKYYNIEKKHFND